MGHFWEHQARVAAQQDRQRAAPAPEQAVGPARRRQQNVAKRGSEPKGPAGIAPMAGPAGVHQAVATLSEQFLADVESLHGLTREEKLVRKLDLVERYRAHAEAFLAGGHPGLDDVISARWTIWLWDIDRVEEFVRQCRRAEDLGLRSPFDTPLREFRWYRIVEWARNEHKAGRSPQPYFDDVLAELTAMPDSIAAEYLKLHGILEQAAAEAADDPVQRKARLEAAAAAYQAALDRNAKVGVGTRLAQVTATLRKLAEG